MPFFSILIPSHCDAAYLPGCLNSLLAQSCRDWEAIVVIDGDVDGSADIVRGYAERDPRIALVVRERNEGTHRARMTAVERCTGRYALFLDSDDELVPDSLASLKRELERRPVEILHFGIKVLGPSGEVGDFRADFERGANAHEGTLRGRQIVDAAFAQDPAMLIDWRVTQRAFDTLLLKTAFEHMTTDHLVEAEDAYEFFVIACLARELRFAHHIVAYQYNMGGGITASDFSTSEALCRSMRNNLDSANAARAFARQFSAFDLTYVLDRFRETLVWGRVRFWEQSVPDEHKVEVAEALAEIAEKDEVAAELMRAARDEARAMEARGETIQGNEPLLDWCACAERLHAQAAEPCHLYEIFAREASASIEAISR